MSEHNLNTLAPSLFMKMGQDRAKNVDKASSVFGKEPSVNILAKLLHPDIQHVIVSDIVNEDENTRSYVLIPDKKEGTEGLAFFAAGQYISVYINVDGREISRPYSLSSAPLEALEGRYRITIRRTEGGLVSNYIYDNVRVGDQLNVSAPNGTFTYEPLRDARHVIALAGGSGITPFISMAKAIKDGDEDFELTLIYGCRAENQILFKDELDSLHKSCGKINIVYVLSDEEKEGYEHGFITSDLVKKYSKNDIFSVFVCGPSQMTEYLEKELEKLNLRRKFIRFELRGENVLEDKGEEKVEITIKSLDKEYTFTGLKKLSILRNLEDAGISPKSSCRSGECGLCRSRLIEGDVYIEDKKDKRREADEKFGYIHPCCTYPMTDITLEVALKLP